MGAALVAWMANPANLTTLIGLVEGALSAGEKIYTDLQLKDLNDLLAALKADLAQMTADVKTMDADIDARDAQLQADLDKAT
jgi:hypothetical protein